MVVPVELMSTGTTAIAQIPTINSYTQIPVKVQYINLLTINSEIDYIKSINKEQETGNDYNIKPIY